ncbi:MAG: CvpA family protein [Myxococcaceae bacterium]|nr:CvpA family protein [Myxococcaceae bacterium]MCI0673140.1 CvpA family protein [Myxococcaceae bacterium]
MAIDVTVLCVVLFFGLLGALSGASRQLAHLLAIVAAVLLARPLGGWVAPLLGGKPGAPGTMAPLLATIFAFFAVYLAVRMATTPVLQRALAGREQERSGTDRWLGFALGALKASAVVYVLFSAATFVQENVEVGGHRLSPELRQSVTGALAHRFNLFRRTDTPLARQ